MKLETKCGMLSRAGLLQVVALSSLLWARSVNAERGIVFQQDVTPANEADHTRLLDSAPHPHEEGGCGDGWVVYEDQCFFTSG